MDKSDAVKEIDEFCVRLASTGSESKGPSTLNAKHCLLIFVRSFVIAALIFLVSALVLPPSFDDVDDVHMSMIASGVGICSQPDPHIVFGHIFWGQALAWLYSLNSNVPWYGISLCLAHIFALALVFSVFTWERASTARRALLLILYVFSLLSLWANLQFTSTAIFLASAASFVALSTLEVGTLSKSGKAAALTLATLALVAASLLRLNAAFIVVALFVGLICCRFASVNFSLQDGVGKGLKRFSRSKLCAGLLIAVCMFVTVGGLRIANSAHYTLDPKWRAFEEMRWVMVQICDYGKVSYSEKTKPFFDSVNWTESDLKLCERYFYPIDPILFSMANVKSLLSHFPGTRSDLSPDMVLHEVGYNVFNPLVLPAILLAFTLLPLSNTRIVSIRRQFAYLACLVGVLACLLVFMKLVFRVTIPVSAWALLLAIYYCDESKLKSARSIISTYLSAIPFTSRIPRETLYENAREFGLLALSPVILLAMLVVGVNTGRCATLATMREEFKTALTTTHKQFNGTLYVMPSLVPFGVISPFENPRDYFGDMVVVVPYFAPTPLRKIETRVIPDTLLPYLDDGVYAFSNDKCNARLKDYYWDHHQLRVSFRPCYGNRTVQVFKLEVDKGTKYNTISERN